MITYLVGNKSLSTLIIKTLYYIQLLVITTENKVKSTATKVRSNGLRQFTFNKHDYNYSMQDKELH